MKKLEVNEYKKKGYNNIYRIEIVCDNNNDHSINKRKL